LSLDVMESMTFVKHTRHMNVRILRLDEAPLLLGSGVLPREAQQGRELCCVYRQ
ncbi:unnamed protein product, partial [Sphenostylis stenocarpa]